MFINAYFKTLFDEVDRALGHEKNILLRTIYIVFSLKLLRMT